MKLNDRLDIFNHGWTEGDGKGTFVYATNKYQIEIDKAKAQIASDLLEIFTDAFEAEIKAQEFMIDEAEWNGLIKALKAGRKAIETYCE